MAEKREALLALSMVDLQLMRSRDARAWTVQSIVGERKHIGAVQLVGPLAGDLVSLPEAVIVHLESPRHPRQVAVTVVLVI